MIVVADTSPLNYFLQIKCESLLPSLHQHVLVPPAVLHEKNVVIVLPERHTR
jgi:predicted nucleic acid-binding protein